MAISSSSRQVHDYNHSRPFDVWKWSEAPEVNHAVDQILEELEPFIYNVRKKRRQYRNAVKKIVLDLYVAHQQDPGLFVAYSRMKANYVTPKRYKRIFMSYHKGIAVIDAMVELGYIHNKKGFNDRVRGCGRQSRMRAEQKPVRLIEAASVRRSMVTRRKDKIILKDGNGRLMDYEETLQVIEWRRNLKWINSLLAEAEIRLDLSASEEASFRDDIGFLPDFTANSLYRVFNNGSFDQGGRFYGHWVQNVPKRYRSRLTIDGMRTTELDYSGLHINMLYRLVGEDLPGGDVYRIDGYGEEIRPLLKVILLVMINAKNSLEAVRAVWNDSVARDFGYDQKGIKAIMERFVERHAQIRKFFNSGSGVRLQFLDSQIAERVLQELAEKRIVCVPIHGSFIVQERHEADLREAMERAFLELHGALIPIEERH